MGAFFQELAKKLAERWVSLLVLPGVLFIAASYTGLRLGHAHAVDWTVVVREATRIAGDVAKTSGGTQAVLVVVLLLGAAGVGLFVQGLAGVTSALWLGRWPWPFAPLHRSLTRWRLGRWQRRGRRKDELRVAHPVGERTPEQQHAIDGEAAKANRIALARPGRPTWMGDRVHSVEQIALNRYGVDLTFGWPRLWLVLPDPVRAEITSANASFAAAVAVGTWAWPYLVLAAVWWPAGIIGFLVGCTGWVRARAAAADLGVLTESALDLHGRALAVALGVGDPDAVGPLSPDEGAKITDIVRKGR
ncbi:MAG: hypothetical protein ABIQ18_10585 [Umezawaea sp.]